MENSRRDRVSTHGETADGRDAVNILDEIGHYQTNQWGDPVIEADLTQIDVVTGLQPASESEVPVKHCISRNVVDELLPRIIHVVKTTERATAASVAGSVSVCA